MPTKTELLKRGYPNPGRRTPDRNPSHDTYQAELPVTLKTPNGGISTFMTYYLFQSRRGFGLRIHRNIGQGHSKAHAESLSAPQSLIDTLLMKGAMK